jgi:hypothetical protein
MRRPAGLGFVTSQAVSRPPSNSDEGEPRPENAGTIWWPGASHGENYQTAVSLFSKAISIDPAREARQGCGGDDVCKNAKQKKLRPRRIQIARRKRNEMIAVLHHRPDRRVRDH